MLFFIVAAEGLFFLDCFFLYSFFCAFFHSLFLNSFLYCFFLNNSLHSFFLFAIFFSGCGLVQNSTETELTTDSHAQPYY